MCCPINLNGNDSQQIPGVLYERKSQTGYYKRKSFYRYSKALLWTILVKNWYQWKHLTIQVNNPPTLSFFVAITEAEEMNYNWDKGKWDIVQAGSDLVHQEDEKLCTIPCKLERIWGLK